MDIAQLSALRSIMVPRPKLVSARTFSNTGTPVTFDVPRATGFLCLVLVYAVGGTAIPGTPTGFTSLGNAASSATTPGLRYAYKFLNGSEALTLTSAAASATDMHAHVWLVSGVLSSRVPAAGAGATGSSTSADPAAFTIGTRAQSLMFVSAAWNSGSQTLTGVPIGFTRTNLSSIQTTNLYSVAVVENRPAETIDPSAFIGTASAAWRANNFVCYAGN